MAASLQTHPPPPRRRRRTMTSFLHCRRPLPLLLRLALVACLLAAASVASVLAAGFDPFKVLGVTRQSSAADIKKAYKTQAKIWHPDKNTDPSAQLRFQQVSDAYELLTDPVQRADFEKHGTVRSRREREQEEAQRAFQAQQAARAQQYHSSHHHYGYGYDPAYARRQEAYLRGEDDSASGSVRLTSSNIEYLVHGATVTTQTHTNEGWLIYVHSGTCGDACTQLTPTFAFVARNLKKQFGGRIRTGRINAEFEQSTLRKIGVNRVPTIVAITLTPTGEVSRSTMAHTRDSRGVLQAPTASALLDFVAAAVWPTQKDGRVAGGVGSFLSSSYGVSQGTAPLFDITQGLASFKDSAAGAQALRAKLLAFQNEHGEFPHARSGWVSSPYLHVYFFSRHARPSPLLKFLAHKHKASMRFAHISLPLIAPSSTLMRELAANFPGVDLPRSVSEGAFVLVSRESSLKRFEPLTPDAARVEEDTVEADSVSALLTGWNMLAPRLEGSNFFSLCYPHYDMKSTASAHASPHAHRECFILFADTQAAAHKVLLPIVGGGSSGAAATSASANQDAATQKQQEQQSEHDEGLPPPPASSSSDSSAAAEEENSMPSLPRHVQLGWMNPRDQPQLYGFFREALLRHLQTGPGAGSPQAKQAVAAARSGKGVNLTGVLVRAKDSSFAVLPLEKDKLDAPSAPREIAAWIQSATGSQQQQQAQAAQAAAAGNTASAAVWIDGRAVGGLPYPVTLSGSTTSVGGAGSVLVYLIQSPWRWLQAIAGVGSSSASESALTSGSTLVLVLVFTLCFLLTTSSVMRIVNS